MELLLELLGALLEPVLEVILEAYARFMKWLMPRRTDGQPPAKWAKTVYTIYMIVLPVSVFLGIPLWLASGPSETAATVGCLMVLIPLGLLATQIVTVSIARSLSDS